MDDEKHLLVYSYDGAGTFSIKLDDQTTQSNSSPYSALGSIGATEMPFLIGWEHAHATDNRFSGRLAELIVVNEALSEAEIDAYRDYATTQRGF